MSKLEETIKWLSNAEAFFRKSAKPAYYIEFNGGDIADHFHDALELLKKQEVKHGRWEDNKVAFYHVCSECGATVRCSLNEILLFECSPRDVGLNYCPNCGAKMGEEGDGE